MGQYSEEISKRINHTKIKDGYCLICGTWGKLSEDHVPPKGSITITRVEQLHIVEVMGGDREKIKGVPSRNGSKFKTICQKCNNEHLGKNDGEIAKVCKSLTEKVKSYFSSANHPYTTINTDVNAVKFARAIIGHILSATSVDECKSRPQDIPYFKPLQEFVLGDDKAIDSTHDMYYWFYPFSMSVSAKMVGFLNEGHTSILSILSFFPIAFMVTLKNEGIFPAHAHQLLLNDRYLTLDLSTQGYEFAQFPFHLLKGNQAMLLTDHQAIISYPIKSRKGG